MLYPMLYGGRRALDPCSDSACYLRIVVPQVMGSTPIGHPTFHSGPSTNLPLLTPQALTAADTR